LLAQQEVLSPEPEAPHEPFARATLALFEEVVEAIRHTGQNAPCDSPIRTDFLYQEIPITLQGLAIQNGERHLTSGIGPEISALASINEVAPTEFDHPRAEPRNESFSLTAIALAIKEHHASART
jgi:hypothetical protein